MILNQIARIIEVGDKMKFTTAAYYSYSSKQI